jgi:hypothetical protein
MGTPSSALLAGCAVMSRDVHTRPFHRQGEAMETDTLIFLSVIVALGVGGVIVYLKGR